MMVRRRSIGLAIVLGTLLAGGADRAVAVKVVSATETFGPFDLQGESLQQMPAGLIPIEFGEAVWVIGYSTQIVDASGEPLSDDLHCHTMLMSPMDERWMGSPINAKPFKGLYTDGYTTEIVMPEGHGLFIDKDERFDLAPMFNNRSALQLPAAMAITVHYVRPEDLTEPLTPLFTTVAAVADPHLYMVPPGEDIRERQFRFPYEGNIQAMGVHIHPYGRSIELINETRGETVWKSSGSVGDDGQLTQMPFFSNKEGYRFGPDDRFTIRATYFNPTEKEQDAMAGLFIFFSTEDGKLPLPQ